MILINEWNLLAFENFWVVSKHWNAGEMKLEGSLQALLLKAGKDGSVTLKDSLPYL